MPSGNDDGMNYRAPEGSQMPASSGGYGSDEYSRRKFLRAAVIGTAGVAGAAGVAGVVLAQRGGSVAPGIISIRQVSGTSDGDYKALFEDTNCGTGKTSTEAAQCGNYTGSNTFTVNQNGKTTEPGSFFVVLAIHGLPGQAGGTTYSILAQEKLSTEPDTQYANIPTSGNGSSSQPFEYQQANSNVQIYEYPTGTIVGTGPYALSTAPYNSPSHTDSVDFANSPGNTFQLTSTQDVLIFIHVNWGNKAGTIGGTGTETIDFQITLTNTGDNSSAVETVATTGVQG